MTGGKDDDTVTPLRPLKPCPICGKKSAPKFHPFCSRHCADVDLNRWLKGSYVIPAAEEQDDWSEDGEGPRNGD
ncbi:MAG: DNA gyrase inhibitor YacG [Kangiella sp.]|nr:DNA gyrase inhibitor YacG [Kangiella sp.]